MGSISQINPLPLKLLLPMVFIMAVETLMQRGLWKANVKVSKFGVTGRKTKLSISTLFSEQEGDLNDITMHTSVDEMSRRIKALAIKADSLSSIPRDSYNRRREPSLTSCL